MKQFFSLLAAATISLGAFAQLPNGSIAPDFTATDINGVQHNLYSYLDSGYSVILDFSATWCGPCWDYHQAGTLETIHETYGPDGSNEVIVLHLEADDQTTAADLNGTGANTAGDWVTGTQYAIIDNAGSIFDSFNGAYFPTIYTVCPNRILTESGQVDVAAHANIFQDADCQYTTSNNDAWLVNSDSDLFACQGEATLRVNLMNNGLNALNACTITAYDGSTVVGSVDWTGNLDTYEVEIVEVGTASLTAQTTFDIEITSTDEIATNNSTSATVELIEQQSTNNVRLNLLTDAYPNETYWALLDNSLNVIDEGGPYANPGEEIIVDWQLDLGCYTFVMQDAYGDGLHASWANNGAGPDGSFSLDAMDGSAVSSTLLSSYAPDEFSVLVMPFEVSSTSDVEEEAASASTVTMFPNPTQGLSNIQFTTGVAAKTSFEVTNLLGERVMTEDFGTLSAGTHRMELNLEGFEAGLYLVNFTAGGETTILRVTKQ